MSIQTIDAKTLKSWLDKNEAIVVDVREPAEHAAENIFGSTLLPLSVFTKAALPNTDGKKIVIHCRSGSRATSACKKLLAEDPDLEVYNLEGGISAWSLAGNQIASSGKFFLPLDRQVQLTIGLGVLIVACSPILCTRCFPCFQGFLARGLCLPD